MIIVCVHKQAYQMWYGWFELLRRDTQQHLQDAIILWNCTQHDATCTVYPKLQSKCSSASEYQMGCLVPGGLAS